MNVSYRWLQDYTSVPWKPAELAHKLTMSGLEVENIEDLAPDLSGVYVGKIVKIEPHPGNSKLKICEISLGNKTIKVVCGAPNQKIGMKIPVAVEGTSLPSGLTIKASSFKGVVSYGMACSEAELGLGEDKSGLMELPNEVKEGLDLAVALGLDDTILDVDVYANRPDCMSMLGIAREVAALSGTKVNQPQVTIDESEAKIEDLTSIVVNDVDKCPRYSARIIRNIRIKDSPLWMQQRLRAAGMRPINNVVDITNFVMLEIGQPLHAFDYDKLHANRIVVRTPNKNEKKFVTLDGIERELAAEMLMICDGRNPVCIGGVMGGENTEVTNKTQTILLEAASFAPANIRYTGRKLAISSEAAARFEKGIDPNLTIDALNRAAQLLALYADGEIVSGIIDIDNTNHRKNTITLRPDLVNQILGTEIATRQMLEILDNLGMDVDCSNVPWKVSIPSFRQDLELECDLVEEIARFYGYEMIPVTLPQGPSLPGGEYGMMKLTDQLRDALVGAGLNEVLNYSFVNAKSIVQSGLDENDVYSNMIELANPITEEHAVMRTTLMPGLLECAARNINHQHQKLSFFEFGKVYIAQQLPLADLPQEETRLGLLYYGPRNENHWSCTSENYDLFDLKGTIELILNHFSGDFLWEESKIPIFHPGRCGVVKVEDKIVVQFGEVHPHIQKNYRISDRIYLAEINIEQLMKYQKGESKFTPLAKFPMVSRDMAILVPESIRVGDIVNVLKQAGGDMLQSVNIFDVYQGKQVESGKKSVAFSFVFQAGRTLTDEEVNSKFESMYDQVKQKFQAEIR